MFQKEKKKKKFIPEGGACQIRVATVWRRIGILSRGDVAGRPS